MKAEPLLGSNQGLRDGGRVRSVQGVEQGCEELLEKGSSLILSLDFEHGDRLWLGVGQVTNGDVLDRKGLRMAPPVICPVIHRVGAVIGGGWDLKCLRPDHRWGSCQSELSQGD